MKKKAASMIVKPEKYDISKVVEELKTREKLSLESLINIITEASSILSIYSFNRKRTDLTQIGISLYHCGGHPWTIL